jgi:drug/metabolite transporter (DMT)-like permease
MPTFQTLSIGMAVGFLCLAALRRLRGEKLADMVPRSFGLLIAGVIGILGTNAFNFIAITRISPAQASVIAYLWPMMAIVLAATLGLRRLQVRHAVAVLLGFAGAVLVIDPFGQTTFDVIGIACALLAGLSWAGYTTYRMIDDRGPSDAVGIYSLLAAVACLIAHIQLEQTYAMSAVQIVAVLGLGIAPMGLANAVWDYGVSRGDARTLSILAYGTPLVATLLLVILGLAAVTPLLAVGALLIVVGAAIGTWPGRGA